jgi:hypothetical protein
MRRILTVLLAATVSAGFAAPASADPVPLNAPYAQAAANVAANGELLRTKNIDQVTMQQTGVYCVHVSDPNIDIAKSSVTATLDWRLGGGGTIRVYPVKTSRCNNDPSTIAVATYDKDSKLANSGFFLAVQ